MKLSLYLRNMGPTSNVDTLRRCAAAADDSAVDTLWLADHIAIPPDDAAGSNGRYLDPLATSAFLAACTRRVRLGPGVLVLPYRPILPTAKWIATIQELSQERFRLGVGVGWMEAEFRAVGVARKMRGRVTDEGLDFLLRAFAEDVVESNGQPLLFRPRPSKPEIIVGGGAPHALRRAAKYGDGWMPFGFEIEPLTKGIAELRTLFAEQGKKSPQVVAILALDLTDRAKAAAQLAELEGIGVTEVVHAWRYEDAAGFERAVRQIEGLR